MKSFSQLGQDLHVIDYYKSQHNRFYVEVGAHDGITMSNTLFLEKQYLWHGICIEADPNNYEKLLKNRKLFNTCVNEVIYSESGKEVDFVLDEKGDLFEGGLLSGIDDCINVDIYKQKTQNCKRIKLITKTLTEILDECDAPKFIEYLSIDTEGSELEILKGIDYEKYKFGFITIEHNYIEPNRTQIREYLTNKGYMLKRELLWDDCYVLIESL